MSEPMGYARSRFSSALFLGVTGAVLAVGAFTLTPRTERWLGFGVGCGALIALALAFAFPRRGAVQRVLDLPTALVGAWLIVSARAIQSSGAGSSAAAIKWFNFAGGAAICAAGLTGLLVHEWGLERDLRLAYRQQRASGRGADASGRGADARGETAEDAAHRDGAVGHARRPTVARV